MMRRAVGIVLASASLVGIGVLSHGRALEPPSIVRRRAVVVCSHALTEDGWYRVKSGSDYPSELVLRCFGPNE